MKEFATNDSDEDEKKPADRLSEKIFKVTAHNPIVKLYDS